MKSVNNSSEELAFSQTVALAVIRLKQQLRRDYEEAYPHLSDIIPAILEQEEKNAWVLSAFPHLLLPALVEARCQIFKLKLRFQSTAGPRSANPRRSHATPLPAGIEA